MPDLSRLQVRKNDTENTWQDVGNKIGNEPVPVSIRETLPTSFFNNNASLAIAWDSSDYPITLTKTISGTSYQKTFTWDGSGNLTNFSSYVQI